MRMQSALTQMEGFSVCVKLDSLEMELIAMVWHYDIRTISEVASTIYSNSYYEVSYLVRSRPRVPIDVTVSVRLDA